jgi:hypothetical protein
MYTIPTIQTELTEEGIALQKRIEERSEPLKDISSFYAEARKLEEEARAKAELEEVKNLPPVKLSPEQHIEKLTEQLEKLTKQLEGKGE